MHENYQHQKYTFHTSISGSAMYTVHNVHIQNCNNIATHIRANDPNATTSSKQKCMMHVHLQNRERNDDMIYSCEEIMH